MTGDKTDNNNRSKNRHHTGGDQLTKRTGGCNIDALMIPDTVQTKAALRTPI